MLLIKNMQRQDIPLQLYSHTVRQPLLYVKRLINKRAELGRATRFIKVRAQRGEPLNERADALAAAQKVSPHPGCALALQNADTYETERYILLRNRLTECLPGWEVGIHTFAVSVGIRGSYDPDTWYANLIRFGLTAVQIDNLMLALVSQTLTELTELYSVRYAVH
jgi:hypothetical protein